MEFPERARNLRGIVICTTPRSGSNLLCQAMTETGVLGRPAEYFNHAGRVRYDRADYPRDRPGQIAAILSDGATGNGIFALKLFPSQSRKVMRQLDWVSALPPLAYVYLTRDDLLGQAISLDIAQQTGRFRAQDAAAQMPAYDARRINRSIDRLAEENACWERFFARRGLTPLRLRYEHVSTDLAMAVAQIGALVGQAAVLPAGWQPALSVQRDTASATWRQQFLAQQERRPAPLAALRRLMARVGRAET